MFIHMKPLGTFRKNERAITRVTTAQSFLIDPLFYPYLKS
jgi:hypothetical protein